MTNDHVLIAIDALTRKHLDRIAAALGGWATWERLSEHAPEPVFRASLKRATIVLGTPAAAWLFETRVRWVQCGNAGVDPFLGQGLETIPGFTLCNARGVMSAPVAEHAVAMLFALTRMLHQHARDSVAKRFERAPAGSYRELNGATVCIVGLGDIGLAVAHRCAALGMRVVGVRRGDPGPTAPLPTGVAAVFPVTRLREAVAEADHVIVTAPGGEATRALVDAAAFAALPRGAIFVNVARGSVVDEGALIAALRSGQLAGAGLDVFAEEPLPASSPLWDFEQVLITPHVGGQSDRGPDRLCALILANLHRYRDGQPLANAIDLTGP